MIYGSRSISKRKKEQKPQVHSISLMNLLDRPQDYAIHEELVINNILTRLKMFNFKIFILLDHSFYKLISWKQLH